MLVQSATAASILVVDDTPENLRVLANLLDGQGYEARPVTSGRQALQAVAHAAPDLILLDVTMPEMDGYQVCSHLKADPRWQDIPVIFLTAMADTAHKVKGFAVGGVDYVTKPFQIEEVLARVRTHLNMRRTQQELAQNHAQLRSLEVLREDLSQMIVHDMRSPLMVVQGALELLRNRLAGTEDAGALQDVRVALRAVGRVAQMANDLLDVSRLEAGKLPLSLAKYDLAELARQAVASLAELDPTRTIQVQAPGAVQATCDAALLRRVLENLLNNGIKHTPRGSPLQIDIAPRGERMRVVVQDEGPGVPAEARQTIFDKFGTVALRQAGKYHSAGLGLAFCRLAVEAHGGTIGVDCEGRRGSAFWFELPVV